MKHSDLLRAKIGLAGGAVPRSLERFWSSPDLGRLFPEFLILLHQIVRASVPVMETGLEVAKKRVTHNKDALCGRLVRYLATHIEDERDHDAWLLDDLSSLGFSPASVWERTPPAAVANLVGAQYYWILHHHPIALLGYIAVLEGAPPTTSHIDAVQKNTGLPDSAFRTYRKHAELDPSHRGAFDRFVDDLPLDGLNAALLGLSAINTVNALDDAVRGLLLAEGRIDE